ncbi:hypothetical protein BSLG_005650 [Batrachochytrium salamandrivorans]|nr:hypothetical protein BSLG_005650 [Batrachochytrium salamandrivorans]
MDWLGQPAQESTLPACSLSGPKIQSKTQISLKIHFIKVSVEFKNAQYKTSDIAVEDEHQFSLNRVMFYLAKLSTLPTKIRDAVLESHGGMPTTDVNTQVYVRKMEEQHTGAPSESRVAHGIPSGSDTVTASVDAGLSQEASTKSHKPNQRRNFPPQSHAQAHAQSERMEAKADAAYPSAQALVASMTQLPTPPPPPGQGPQILYPSQNPAILGTTTRSFRS